MTPPLTLRTQLTIRDLRDLTDRAATALEHKTGALEQESLVADLRAIALLCQQAIESSHMGCALEVVILELGDEPTEEPS